LQFEEILVFSKAGAGSGSKDKNVMLYNPQGIVECNIVKRNKKHSRGQHIHQTNNVGDGNIINSDSEYVQKYTNYPSNLLKFDRDSPQLHPTQKPVALFEYLIKTYTNEGDIVLDTCIGSGTTAVAAINTRRQYIGYEISSEFHDIALQRINDTKQSKGSVFDE
jgi:site-specific DNA-methyltransferase (adenine-specific)